MNERCLKRSIIMDRLKLIEEINTAIAEKRYVELLDSQEDKLIAFLSQYSSDDLFILINKIIVLQNYNTVYKSNDYDKYDENKHLSLRMLLSLPLYYYKNVEVTGGECIGNFEKKAEEMIGILKELEFIYYYYPCRDQLEFKLDDKKMFYMNYFKSYFFDFPEFRLGEFWKFIYDNENVFKETLEDPHVLRTLQTANYFQYFEENLYSLKNIKRYICEKFFKVNFKEKEVWLSFPNTLIKFLLRKNELDYSYLSQNYIYDITEKREKEYTRMIDAICSGDNKVAMKNENSLFFPRNYYWIYRWYNNAWRSSAMRKELKNGKTYKSDKHEKEIKTILEAYFGKDKVFSSVHLKKKKGHLSEKDFIVLYDDYVISFEAKARLLPAPHLGVEDGMLDIKSKFDESIKKAVEQGEEIGEAISQGKAIFYNSNLKNAEVILDLNNHSRKKFLQIVMVYEEFLNLGTNVEQMTSEEQRVNFWLVDVKNLEHILADTVGKGEGRRFIEYVQKRINTYGLINVQSGEEQKIYNLYKVLPVFFEKGNSISGLSIHI